jgi:hypothetical protein
MFRVRAEQIDALSHDAARRYENELLQHLRQHFPQKCDLLTESVLREEIHYAIKRAGSYGITAGPDVRLYAELMFSLGRDFDRDPRFPWAQSILNNRELPNPSARIDWAHTLAARLLEKGA